MMLVSSYIPVLIMMLKSSGVVVVSYMLNMAGLGEKIKLCSTTSCCFPCREWPRIEPFDCSHFWTLVMCGERAAAQMAVCEPLAASG